MNSNYFGPIKEEWDEDYEPGADSPKKAITPFQQLMLIKK